MSSPYKKAILYLFCNVARLIKIQFDELVSFHSISYLSVVSSMRFKCVLFSLNFRDTKLNLGPVYKQVG